MSKAGFFIRFSFERPPGELVRAFGGIPASNISDCMGRLYTPRGVQAYNRPGTHLVGTAFTVKAPSGDNLMIHKALTMARQGDVIVVDGCGDESRALVGEIMTRIAIKNKLAGLVIDGLIRDVASVRELDLPVYARGVTPGGPYKEGPGEINTAISCGGVVVEPGDIVVGDDDGLVVIPLKYAESVLALARKKMDDEEATFEAIEAGTMDYSWIDKILTEKGCQLLD